jgi:hypothetical protein
LSEPSASNNRLEGQTRCLYFGNLTHNYNALLVDVLFYSYKETINMYFKVIAVYADAISRKSVDQQHPRFVWHHIRLLDHAWQRGISIRDRDPKI